MQTQSRVSSARERELLQLAYEYVLRHGLTSLSLRPLAQAIGSSPRVLLFLFGSKEGLIRALLARAREDELSYLAELRDSQGMRDAGCEVWAWLAAPSHRPLLALWVEGYARSLLGEPGPWAGFGRDTVNDWLELLAERQPADSRDAPEAEADEAPESEPETLRALATLLPDGSTLVVANERRRSDETLRRVMTAFAWALGGTIALGAVGGLWLSAQFLRRIDVMRRAARGIMAGDWSRRIPLASVADETRHEILYIRQDGDHPAGRAVAFAGSTHAGETRHSQIVFLPLV